MDGNPEPSADFRWPHLTGSSPTNVPSAQLYPFVYSSTYTLNNIDASYCGRILQTTLRNNIGSSLAAASTNVTLLCRFTSLVLKCLLLFTDQFRGVMQFKSFKVGLNRSLSSLIGFEFRIFALVHLSKICK